MSGLTLNGTIPVLDIRFTASWRGAWVVEAQIDIDPDAALPSGSVTLNVYDQDLVGTIDPTATARFGDIVTITILAGKNGGWGQTVTPRDFHNDATVKASDVISATASEIGESVTDLPTLALDVDYVRAGGVARAVLAGFDWYVDFAGITHVTSHPTVMTIPDDVVVDEYDPLTRTLRIGTMTTLIVPGTSFTDPNGRWDGALIVRDVEQHFTGAGESVVIALCSSSAESRNPFALLERLIADSTKILYARSYRYRIVTQDADGRLELQAVVQTPGLPDVLPINVWPGTPGMTAKYPVTGVIVRVAFLEGTPSIPIVVGFDPGAVPTNVDFAASIMASITAPSVQLGGAGALPVAFAAPLLFIMQAIGIWLTGDIALLSNPPTSIMFAAYAPAKAALLTQLSAAIVAQLTSIPTEKVICE